METILLVDDDPAILRLCQQILRLDAYNVLTAPSGEMALRVLQSNNNQVDLAVLDVMMPFMNGIELAGRIQKANPDIPVVLMTGYGPAEIARVVGENNPYRIIWKPFTSESLRRMVENVISASTGASA
ncbi:MAG TPA: response regulator [Bryobacteraceae bacterium]|nr:response regulator [Bryobacteraceae bacterium]